MRALVLAAFLVLLAGCPPAKPKETRTKPATSPGAAAALQVGLATWYASGTMTASGERFDKWAMTAAHRTLPFGSIVKVTHRRTGRSVTVRINDRGPFGSKKRIIDVSRGAAEKLGIIEEGVAPVTIEVLERGKGRRKR